MASAAITSRRAVRRASGESGTMPRTHGSAPDARIAEASVYRLESRICPFPSGASTSAISSPVQNTATRGRLRTCTFDRPTDASRPISAGRSTVPASRIVSPLRRSSPACRTESPFGVGAVIVTTSLALSLSSTRTTVSAPSGIGAPVMMRIASPGPTSRSGNSPAATSLTTRSSTGADATSSPRTAYPSIAELRKGGTSRSAATSSASTSPRASWSGVSTAASVGTPARMRASASSALMSFGAGFAEVALFIAASLGRVDADLGRLHADPDLAALREIELSHRGRGHLGDDRHLPFDADTYAIALEVERRRVAAPDVPRGPFGTGAMERDGTGVNRGEDLAVDTVRRLDGGAAAQSDMSRRRDATKEVHPDEVGDVPRARPPRDLGRRTRLNDAAGFEDHQSIRERDRFERIVRDDDAYPVERREMAPEVPPDRAARGGVQRGERLVQEKQARFSGERARESDALRLPARERTRLRLLVRAEVKPIEPGLRSGTRVLRRRAARAKTEGHVLERGEMREKQVILEDDTDRTALRSEMDAARHVVEDDIVERDATGIQRDESGEGAKEGRLAGAVRSQHRDDLARRHVDRDVEIESAEPDGDLGFQHQNARR